TPQQNGVAECMNITLMDTAAYLINRSPSKAIEKKKPIEMWSGHPSDYEMLSIFGCVVYPHDKQAEKKNTHEPLTYDEAVAYDDSSKWKAAMKEEMDDMLIACKSKAEIGSTKSLLKNEFDIKDLEKAKKILGMEIVRDGVARFKGFHNFGMVYATNRGNHVDITGFVDLDYAKDPNKGREVLEAKTVKVLKVGTEYNVADPLMKVVPGLKLQHFLEWLNVGVG
nr:retrotransposon protein, putative, Ty1-copia subclass [Tanacetum cinerariifolium]